MIVQCHALEVLLQQHPYKDHRLKTKLKIYTLSCARDNLQPVTDTLTDALPPSTIPWRGMKNSSVKMFRMMQIHCQSTAASTENSFTTAGTGSKSEHSFTVLRVILDKVNTMGFKDT